VMERARVLAGRVEPGLLHLEHEEVVAVDQSRIGHATFQVGVALVRSSGAATSAAGTGVRPKALNLSTPSAGGIAAAHHLFHPAPPSGC